MVSYHPQLSKSICVERRGEKILNSKDTDGWKDEHLVQEAEDSLAEKEHQNCQKIKKNTFFTSCPKSAVGGYKLIFLEKNSYGHSQPKVRKSLEISGMSSEDFLSKGQMKF